MAEQNRQAYGKGVREFWANREDKLLEKFPKIYDELKTRFEKSPEDAQDFINEYIIKTQDEAYKDAKKLFEELM